MEGKKVPVDGELWYREYNVRSLVDELGKEEFGFERRAYLLLFGKKPDARELQDFETVLAQNRTLPTNFTRDVIMKAPSGDIMNSMTRSILTLASYDEHISSMDLENSIRQCILLIAQFPMLAVYAYHAHSHYNNDESMYIHRPNPDLSTAENILMMLRHDTPTTLFVDNTGKIEGDIILGSHTEKCRKIANGLFKK